MYNIVMKLRKIRRKIEACQYKWRLNTKSGKWWNKQTRMDKFVLKMIMFYAIVLTPFIIVALCVG